MTATFFFLTPMMYLSGFIFPIENMPAVIQPVTYLIPLRYFLVIVRGIFLKGVGLGRAVAAGAALLAVGRRHSRAGGRAIEEDAELTPAGRRRQKITRRPASMSSAMTRMLGSRTSRSTA